MSLKKGEAEQILINAIDEWLQETNINGTKLIDENLQKLNKANILALGIFENVEKIEFEAPSSGLSFTSTYVYCQDFDIEKAKNKETFQEFIELIDEFSVNPIDGKTIGISYSVDNIWVE